MTTTTRVGAPIVAVFSPCDDDHEFVTAFDAPQSRAAFADLGLTFRTGRTSLPVQTARDLRRAIEAQGGACPTTGGAR